MIYTVTFNPAIDYILDLERLIPGALNRATREQLRIGGKGINVSLVLAELGHPSVAMGFVAGFTGDAIEAGLRETGVQTDFVRLKSGTSRINVKLRAGGETEINGGGPDIPSDSLDALLGKLDALVDGDTLVLAGSIPPTLPSDIYEQILYRLRDREIRTVVDATGELLRRVLRFRPFLVKPNHHELAELFGIELDSTAEIVRCARRLREDGARNVLVSMAGDGALLVDEFDHVHMIPACRGSLKNSVGAGDSMVAGFLAGCVSSQGMDSPDYGYALRLGTAAGGATAFSDQLATRAEIDALLVTLPPVSWDA